MRKPIDKAGLMFVALLCVLVGIVLSIAFMNNDNKFTQQTQDGSLIPRTTQPH